MRPESATIYSIRPRLYMSTSSSCATSTGTDYHAPQKHRKINCFSRRRRSPPPPPFPLKLDSYLFRSSHFQHANKPTPPPLLQSCPPYITLQTKTRSNQYLQGRAGCTILRSATIPTACTVATCMYPYRYFQCWGLGEGVQLLRL